MSLLRRRTFKTRRLQPAPAASPRRVIGLLGGSFNPAHAGHMHVSMTALKQLKLSEVWWLVSPQNPLKSPHGMAPFSERVQAARALVVHPKIRVLDIEKTLHTHYSVDTIRTLLKRFRGVRFIWLMGADNLASFHRWRRWQNVFSLISIAVFDRAPFSHTAFRQRAALAMAGRRLPESQAASLPYRTRPAWACIFMKRHSASGTNLRKTLGKP